MKYFLFITHDLPSSKAVGNEIVAMLKYRIVEKRLKHEMLKPPHFTAHLVDGRLGQTFARL